MNVILVDYRFYYLNNIIAKVFFMEKGEITVYNSERSFKKNSIYDTRNFYLFWIDNRIIRETKLNSYSSRSHSILIFQVIQNLNNANFSKKGTLN